MKKYIPLCISPYIGYIWVMVDNSYLIKLKKCFMLVIICFFGNSTVRTLACTASHEVGLFFNILIVFWKYCTTVVSLPLSFQDLVDRFDTLNVQCIDVVQQGLVNMSLGEVEFIIPLLQEGKEKKI